MKPVTQNPVAKTDYSLCLEEVHFCYFTELTLDEQLNITGRDVNQRHGKYQMTAEALLGGQDGSGKRP